MKFHICLLLIFTLFLSACTPTQQGAAIGGVVGGTIAAVNGGGTGKILEGAAVGGTIGAAAGFVIGKQYEKKLAKRNYAKLQSESAARQLQTAQNTRMGMEDYQRSLKGARTQAAQGRVEALADVKKTHKAKSIENVKDAVEKEVKIYRATAALPTTSESEAKALRAEAELLDADLTELETIDEEFGELAGSADA